MAMTQAGTGQRWAAVVAATRATGAGVLAVAPGASAEPGDTTAADPWLSVVDGYHRVTVPQAAVHEIVGGTPATFELEGSIGPHGTWARLALDPSDDVYPGGFGPLAPGLYVYEYTATMPDRSQVRFKEPSSPVAVTSHPTWNTIFVPGESVRWMSDLPAGGAVAPLTYDSDVTGTERSALVWTPPGYDADRAEPYPVLYLLADAAQTAQEWAELGRAPQILDNLAATGALEPMVVVMGDVAVEDPVSELVDNLVVAGREQLNVSDRPAHQAVAGIGTGATAALQALVAEPGEFSAVGSFSGSLDTPVDAATAQAIDDGTDLLRLYVGNELDPAYDDTYDLVQRLAAAGVDVEVDGVNPASGGTWDSWRENLRDFASRVFRGSDGAPSAGHRPLDGRYAPPAAGSVTLPHVDGNGIVTFETGTQWADAREVTVWANWAPNGAWFRVPMTKVGDRWRVTVGPLDGYYYYRYVVDGVDHKDPADTATTLTGVTPLFVPGQTDHMYADAPAGERGRVSTLAYDSAVAGEERRALVWTPPGYDAERAEPYPVLYLNHGGGQSYGDWIETGRAAQILDNHLRQGAIVPMVVVMGNGNVPDFQAEVFDHLMPAVDQAYHVSSEPSQRAMAGLSMGAMHTLTTWFAHPGEFAYIGAFSGFLFSYPPTDVPAMNAGTRLARVYTGDTTDFTYEHTMGMVDVLVERGIEHEFAGVTVGPHGFDTWMQNLVDLLPRLFRPDTAAGIALEATAAEAGSGVPG